MGLAAGRGHTDVTDLLQKHEGNRGQLVRHEGVEDQRMRGPPEEFSVHLGSHPSGAAGQPAVPKPWGQVA
jgi:hypothetical protein